MLDVNLENIAKRMGDSASGKSTVDPKGYLTSLDSIQLSSDAEIGDIKKARMLLKSVINTNPKHAPGWVAAARLEETVGCVPGFSHLWTAHICGLYLEYTTITAGSCSESRTFKVWCLGVATLRSASPCERAQGAGRAALQQGCARLCAIPHPCSYVGRRLLCSQVSF